jgi:isopenicillin N synthase-like dioxygenase
MPRSLPLVDLAPAFTGDARGASAVARQIDAACRDRGFFYVTGHGVDAALMTRTFETSRRFFALDDAVKARWHMARSSIRRGYDPIGWQSLDPGKPADLKESFYLGVDRDADDPLVRAGTPNHGPNQWPDEAHAPGFRDVTNAYFTALDALGRKLMGLLALGLELPRDYFEAYLRDPMPVLRLLHYPPQPATALPGQVGSGAHTDWGGITLLAQDDTGGLQVQDANGEWIEATPIEGAFVVNLGDMMARWTNDRYRSTPHRVINKASGRDRYSIAFFFDIHYHAIVSALPGCYDDDDPPHYPPISAGEHIIEMYARTTKTEDRRDHHVTPWSACPTETPLTARESTSSR